MKVTILGCGCSVGVPSNGCSCEVCKSEDSKNHRTRSSIFIELNNGKNLLIDVGPDFRYQALKNKIGIIDFIILTHPHNDHVNGLNDLIYLNRNFNKIPIIYANQETLNEVKSRFKFINWIEQENQKSFGTNLYSNVINNYQTLNLDGQKVEVFEQNHGDGISLGVRIDNFVYSTDVKIFPEDSQKFLHNIDIWILDCINYKGTKKHKGWQDVMLAKEKYNPRCMYLTHMSHEWEYNNLLNLGKELNVKACYDNMTLVI